MRIAVTGGTGTLGRAVVAHARSLGHEVVTLSRRAAPPGTPAELHQRADLVTGEGLLDGLAGAEAVIDATNAMRGAQALLVGGTRRLLDAAARVRVRHLVAISIVGIDEAPIRYYRTKLEQERVLAQSPVPWSLVRTTQFHDLIERFAAGAFGVTLVPKGVPVQPIDVREVARHLVAVAVQPAAGRLPDLAGPQMRTFREFAALWQEITGQKRYLLRAPLLPKVGRFLRGGGLCNPNAQGGRLPFGQWLRARVTAAADRPR